MSGRWEQHPAVRSGRDLTRGERAADAIRSGMGSWLFIFVFASAMAAWMLMNGRHGIDPFPFVLLNLALSTLAGLQGAILLIAAKRADQVSSELAQHDYEVGLQDLEIDLRALELLERIAQKLGVEGAQDERMGLDEAGAEGGAGAVHSDVHGDG